MEESCNALLRNQEYESDVYLVELVRLQQIAEKITQTLPYDAPQSFWTSKPPIGLLVKAFQTELQFFKSGLPQKLHQDRKLTLLYLSYRTKLSNSADSNLISALILQHLQSNEIYLYEISLCDWSRHPSAYPTYSTTSQRVETLHQTLLATASFLTTFLSLPICLYSSLPFITWAQTLHAMQVLSKLSLLNDVPGWDLAYVREVMDFSSLMERLTERFEQARRAEEDAQRAQGGTVGSRYEIYTQHIRRVKGWYEGKLRALQHEDEGRVRSQDREQGQGFDVYGVVGGPARQTVQAEQAGPDGLRDDFLLPPEMLEQMDNAYWQDFLAEWASL
jgi:hypothetical protein